MPGKIVWTALAVALAALASAPKAEAETLAARLAAAQAAAQQDTTAWDLVEALTTEVGPRPVGSPQMVRARDWAMAALTRLGFQNVHAEPFTTRAWRRGAEAAEVISPFPQPLRILGLGNSTPTPAGGLQGEIVLFASYQAMLDAPEGALRGRIAVVTEAMTRTQDETGYGAVNPQRSNGPREVAKRGAIAYLVRSLSTEDRRLPHAGAAWPGGIPAAALSPPDAELLERMVKRGRPVVVRLDLSSSLDEAAPAWNVVGELPGTAPGELVIVGGHLDSWDPGTGAIDDGAGVAITVAAARLAAAQPGPRRRTLRVVLWGSEEQGGGGAAYAKAHAADIPSVVLAGESDLGAGRVISINLPAGAAAIPALQAFRKAVAPTGVVFLDRPPEGGGADIDDLASQGAPVIALNQDATHYFDVHHTADDTLDKIDPRDLAQNVSVWTALLLSVADSDANLRPPPQAAGREAAVGARGKR
jgi:hypothetical protein